MRKTTATHQRKKGSTDQLPLPNSKTDAQKIYSVLPIFGFINMTVSCGIGFYRAYANNNVPMLAFTIFLYSATLLVNQWFGQYDKLPPRDKSPKKRNLKISIWFLLSAIMFGFAYQFSKCSSLAASLCFFGIAIGGSALLFDVYFVWDGDRSCSFGAPIRKKEN